MKALVKIWNMLVNIILIAVVILIFAFAGSRLIGYTPYVVTSGSMQSVYPVGSIIYVREAAPEDVQVGDAITFYLNDDTIAVHQVWKINYGEQNFRTQGIDNLDAEGNIIQDASPVPFENLIGLPVFCVPKLGVLYDTLQKPLGICAAAFVVILVILVSVLLTPPKEDSDTKEGTTSIDVPINNTEKEKTNENKN